MQPAQVIVLATPVFLALIALEWWIGRRRGHDTYRLHDALASIGLGMVNQLAGVLVKALGLGSYVLVWQHAAPWQLPVDSWAVWLGALVAYDFLYYWHHRAGHRVAVLWAAHAVHHQSEDYNLSTALRQTGSGWLLGWLFYLPMALAGVPPLVFGVVALIDLLYQFWVHTQQIGRLGWFDRWFCSPSNHRVHHAVNDEYLDKNYGGILMIWDRLFGSFADERDDIAIVYGTRSPLRSWNPLWANLQVYADLARDSWRARRWSDKLRLWWMPPGWQPAELAAREPKPAFDLERARAGRWDPAVGRGAQWLSALLFLVLLGAVTGLLWWAHLLSLAALAAGTAAVLALLGLIAWLGRDPQAATGFSSVSVSAPKP
ncbi:MAG: sterol desaturase family protein [Burkholderiaceae bacterium]|nr:sterol desaturase family protein [Burkholderiaceae bacterium]